MGQKLYSYIGLEEMIFHYLVPTKNPRLDFLELEIGIRNSKF